MIIGLNRNYIVIHGFVTGETVFYSLSICYYADKTITYMIVYTSPLLKIIVNV